MSKSKIKQAAEAAKADGYEYMTSVVKSVYSTTYHHVVPIDEVIESGKWTPAPQGQWGNWSGRLGQAKLPENSINKSRAISKYTK